MLAAVSSKPFQPPLASNETIGPLQAGLENANNRFKNCRDMGRCKTAADLSARIDDRVASASKRRADPACKKQARDYAVYGAAAAPLNAKRPSTVVAMNLRTLENGNDAEKP